MRTVAIEEHFSVPALIRRIDPGAISRRGFRPRKLPPNGPNPLDLLPEIGERRLQAMDEAGITVQVLSSSGPGPDIVPGPDGVAMSREMNEYLAAAIARHPDRFAGFATLPMQAPDAAAAEFVLAVKDLGFLGAVVYGTTEGRFLDHPSYDGLLAAAVELDVPIYIHPHLPPEPVRQAYFSDLPPGASRVLESAGWGWHSETAIHVLRMVVAGTLDRHPRLKLIIGHMGEMLAVPGCAPDVRHRSHHVLGRLPVCPERKGSCLPGSPVTDTGRHGQAHARQCGCAAEAKGRAEVMGVESRPS